MRWTQREESRSVMGMLWVQRGITVMACDGNNDKEMDAFINSTQGC